MVHYTSRQYADIYSNFYFTLYSHENKKCVKMGVKMLMRLWVLVFWLCFVGLVGAEDTLRFNDTLRVYYLDEIVVTATRLKRAVKDLASSVSVVTREDIEASNANSCTDILATVPGLFVQKTSAFGRADVEIRGLGSRGRRLMVLIDGRPVKMGLFGCTVTHSLPLDNVDRIEVVRGPLSVLYGSDALGGVINIITRKLKKGTETDLTTSYGTYNTRCVRLRHGTNLGKFDYYLTGDWRMSDGHLPNSAYDGKDFTAHLGYRFNKRVELTFNGKYFDGYKEEPLRATDPDTLVPNTWNDYERGALDLSLNSKFGGIELFAKLYRNFGHHQFSDGWHSRDFTNGGLLHCVVHPFIGNTLVAGVEFRQQGGERLSEPQGEWTKTEFASFLHIEQLLGKAILSFGGRYNYDEVAGTELCPEVGLVLHLREGVILRAIISKGFRSPQLNELYMFPPSNENLKPERVWNYEIGFDYRIADGVTFEFTCYDMKGDNIIQLEENPTPPPMFLFQNTGKFDFKGVETGLNMQLGYFTGRIYYSYLDPGEKTTGRPGNKLDIVMRYTHDKFLVAFTGQYVGNYYAADNHEQKIDDYFVANVKLSYRVLPQLNVFLAVDNIFDRDYVIYADLPGGAAGLYRMPRRAFTLGVKVELR